MVFEAWMDKLLLELTLLFLSLTLLAIMLSTIRHSLHLSFPSSRKRHTEAQSDACSTRTRTDLKSIATRWVDSKRPSKCINSES
ncbi:uncharacterized protein MYCFIDRAFT_210698, partial [Pseudocercospora fijiensis CIRAD86]